MRIWTLLILVNLAGCASLSQKQCRQGNWYGVGRADGMDGEPVERFNKHRKACGEYGIEPTWPSYWKGREAGLAVYCTSENAFRMGRLGLPNNHVCPQALTETFEAAYQRGQLSKQVHAMGQRIEKLEKEMDNLETEEQRKALRTEIDTLKRQKRSFE